MSTLTISTNHDSVIHIDEIDADLMIYSWRIVRNKPYARRWVKKGQHEFLHRVILSRMIGRALTSKEVVDHINNKPLDNRRSNLRLATIPENIRNSQLRRNNKYGFKGVSPCNNKWRARIMINRKQVHLGYFDTPEQAHEAYKKAAILYFGEFANFGEGGVQ